MPAAASGNCRGLRMLIRLLGTRGTDVLLFRVENPACLFMLTKGQSRSGAKWQIWLLSPEAAQELQNQNSSCCQASVTAHQQMSVHVASFSQQPVMCWANLISYSGSRFCRTGHTHTHPDLLQAYGHSPWMGSVWASSALFFSFVMARQVHSETWKWLHASRNQWFYLTLLPFYFNRTGTTMKKQH